MNNFQRLRRQTRSSSGGRFLGALAPVAILALAMVALLGGGQSSAAPASAAPSYVTPSYVTASSATTAKAPTACKAVDATRNGRWAPGPTTAAWQWQLQGKIDTGYPACVYETDGFETSEATVAKLHSRGVKAICYLDVGSWEEYRPDASEFPKASLGKVYEGYPEERWLDIAHFRKFAPIMEKRIAMCAEKGFDGVEPDNINGWENKTGFPLTRADQRRYNLWIAAQVHKAGMAVALKNDALQARELVGHFDFAVVEECFQYNECGRFEPFVKAGKAVFETEYELPPEKFCAQAKELGFASIRKGLELFAKPWIPCEPIGSD
jgi:hypothetical protein